MGLNGIELLMAAEEKFHIAISDQEARAIEKVGDFYNVILRKLEQQSQQRTQIWDKEAVWDSLRDLMVEQSGVDPAKIKKEARIVKDPGID